MVFAALPLFAACAKNKAPESVAALPAGPSTPLVVKADASPRHDDAQTNHLTAAEFEEKLDASIAAVTRNGPLGTEDAIMLVRVSNTVFLRGGEKTKREKELEGLMGTCAPRLMEALGDSIPNRGMGLFFRKHDLQWGGAPGNIRGRDSYVIVHQ